MFETGLVVKLKNTEFFPSNEVFIKILDKLKQNNSNLCSIIFGRNGALGKVRFVSRLTTL